MVNLAQLSVSDHNVEGGGVVLDLDDEDVDWIEVAWGRVQFSSWGKCTCFGSECFHC